MPRVPARGRSVAREAGRRGRPRRAQPPLRCCRAHPRVGLRAARLLKLDPSSGQGYRGFLAVFGGAERPQMAGAEEPAVAVEAARGAFDSVELRHVRHPSAVEREGRRREVRAEEREVRIAPGEERRPRHDLRRDGRGCCARRAPGSGSTAARAGQARRRCRSGCPVRCSSGRGRHRSVPSAVARSGRELPGSPRCRRSCPRYPRGIRRSSRAIPGSAGSTAGSRGAPGRRSGRAHVGGRCDRRADGGGSRGAAGRAKATRRRRRFRGLCRRARVSGSRASVEHRLAPGLRASRPPSPARSGRRGRRRLPQPRRTSRRRRLSRWP